MVGQRQTYTTKLLPGVELPMASLLELIDRWGDSTD
jgi:hypothetical protein